MVETPSFSLPSVAIFCVVCHSSNSGDSFIFDFLSSRIEYLLVTNSNCHAAVLVNFSMGMSSALNTSVVSHKGEQLVVVSNSFQTVNSSARISARSEDGSHAFHLIFIFFSPSNSDVSIIFLDSLDHCYQALHQAYSS